MREKNKFKMIVIFSVIITIVSFLTTEIVNTIFHKDYGHKSISKSSSSTQSWSSEIVTHEITKSCNKCHGTGEIDCSRCNGTGGKYVYSSTPNYSGKDKTTHKTLERCSKYYGIGKLSCPQCGGDGKVEY